MQCGALLHHSVTGAWHSHVPSNGLTPPRGNAMACRSGRGTLLVPAVALVLAFAEHTAGEFGHGARAEMESLRDEFGDGTARFYSTPGPLSASCWVVDRRPVKRSFGTLIMTTSDDLNVVKRALRNTLPGGTPDAVLVTIDFKNKSVAAEAMRVGWVVSNGAKLQAMADELRQLCLGQAVVMVAAINVRTTTTNKALFAEQPACEGFKEVNGAGACRPSRMWRNTFAYTWGLERLRRCTRYGLHVDSDVGISKHKPSKGRTSWVQLAMDALEQRPDALSINPLQGASTRRGVGAPYCTVPEGGECLCQRTRADNSTWRFMSMSVHRPKVITLEGGQRCGFYLQASKAYTGYKQPFYHVSLQAFLMDLERWQELLPLRLEKPVHHIEKLIEQASHRVGRFHMMYMTSADLSVSKVLQ